MSETNYQNRKARGQCVSCKDQAIPNSVRCQSCKEKHREKCFANYEATYAKQREKAFRKSMERERRLETLDMLLKAEVAKLEKAFRSRLGSVMEQSG